MFILSILCFIGGFSTIKLNPGNPYGIGTVFMGGFLGIQYLKASGKTSPRIIRWLTWVTVIGFLIVDILLVYSVILKNAYIK
jgi:hypothetical protein